MPPPFVSVIIANLNGRAYLERSLPTLVAQTYPHVEVILIDNGSTDDSVAFVTEHFAAVHIIRNPKNLGFAAANNQGIAAARGEYIATLNSDTELEPGWLSELVRGMQTGPDVGMCTSKMVYLSDRHTLDSAGLAPDRAGIAWNRLSGEPDEGQGGVDLEEVFGPCAGAALYRRDMLEAIGTFDEDFFAYLEDIDLAWRARLAGWRCVYVPTARVYHAHSAALGTASPFKAYLLARNKIWTIVKNYPSPQLWIFLPLILAYDAAALAYRVALGRGWSSLRGRFAALRFLPQMLKKRRAVQRAATAPGRAAAWQLMEPFRSPVDVLRRIGKVQAQAVNHVQPG